MKFLEEIVEVVLNKYPEELDEITIVFPNRRAGLFFRKYLAAKIDKPIWSPTIVSIEDFIKGLSECKSADKLELIFELYQVFNSLNKSNESFDKFFYWGNILLQDFDEIDKFLVAPDLLFKNLVHVKNLENDLTYLDADQKLLIAEFWKSFGDKLTSHQKGFLGIWNNLSATYYQFKDRLAKKGIAYDGMIYREVVENLNAGKLVPNIGEVIFAGFNALSKSEEFIISWILKEGKGEVYWDADDYYLKDNYQEAGKYLREMKFGNTNLRGTFRQTYGNAFLENDKNIEVISVASDVGQTQYVSELLQSWNSDLDENTAIVLPNNELLFPLLHALPAGVNKLNITMGYPLSSSAVYGFLDALIDMQIRAEGKNVYHFRPILTILRHPVLVASRDEKIIALEQNIKQGNMIWIPREKIDLSHEMLGQLFSEPIDGLSMYLMNLIRVLARKNIEAVEKEFFFHIYRLLNRLNEFIESNHLHISSTAYQKLFRQMAQSERLPFEGEPLLGLQVMGILETRNLDFDHIIILSMNESLIPPSPKNTSFIPYSIRKVFELPVVDHQDAMYAYIFYRLVQRAKNIYFIYNSSEDNGKPGEVSRFVRQLDYETNLKLNYKTVSSEVTIEDPHQLSILKNKRILENLNRFTSEKNYEKRFTPTALNTYLECRLRFYFKYVLELYEQEEMSEEVDPMAFGNILHHVMEQLYEPFDRDGFRTVHEEDIMQLEKRVDSEILKAFSIQFGSDIAQFTFEGQNILAREIIKKMVMKVLEFDKQRAPFDILGVEAGHRKGYMLNAGIEIEGETVQIGMKGIIDRIELKDMVVRIVDYKTGKDEKNFPDIPSLFDRDNNRRNKAVFQALFYGLLYQASPISNPSMPIQASLFNIRDLFSENFSPLIQIKNTRRNDDILDIRIYLEEFKVELKKLLQEIYDPDVAFSQTEDSNKCKYCPYAGICNR